MSDEPMQRIVAIVGRPNVGKSALFNRMAGRRIAIVHAQSGVTRDRLMCEVSWNDRAFELIDTGGVCNVDGATNRDVIEAGIRGQVDVALGDAALALLVVDALGGLKPMDFEVARLLRTSGCPAIVVVNKTDTPAQDGIAAEFEQLGYPVFPVSALHNRGIDDLLREITEDLPPVENVTEAHPLKVAVVGRPNVGKSSYINRLLRADRVIVSDVPGTTRDSVNVPFAVGSGEQARHYVLIDTAGMQKRNRVNSSLEKFSYWRAERSIREANVVLLVLDATAGPTLQDKKIGAAVVEQGKGCVIVVNKWDLSETTQRQCAPMIADMMPFLTFCPVVFVSSKTGYNVRRSVETIDHVGSQVTMSLPTGVLNRTIMDACEKVHAPAVKGRRLKIFYSTQVGCEPIRIRCFVNDPRCVPANYRSYLAKMIRRKFGLEGAPLVLQFTERRPPR